MIKPMITWLLSVSLITSCFNGKKTVELNVQTKNHLGQPLPGAQVFWDQELLGETDESGFIKAQRDKKINVGSKILIKKESSSHYFSEFSQNILIEEHQAKKELIPIYLDATLFFVPKNNQEETTDSSPSDPSAPKDHQTEKAPPKDQITEKTESLPEDFVPTNKYLDLQKKSDINDFTDISDGPESVHDETNVDPIEPETKASDHAQQTMDKPSLDQKITTIKVPVIRITKQEIDNTPEKIELPRSDLPLLLTVHLSEKKLGSKKTSHDQEHPLGQGTVRLFKKDNANPISTCTSNERGRCVLRLENPLDEQAMIVASKDGYLTASTTVFVKQKSLTKISLKQGKSFDLMTYQKIYDRHRSLEGIKLLLNNKKVGQTNDYGFLSVPWSQASETLTPVSLQEPSGQRIIYETDFVSPPKATLIKFFTPEEDIRPRLGILPPSFFGADLDLDPRSSFHKVTHTLQVSMEDALFKSRIFTQYPSSLILKRIKERNLSIHDVQNDGFERLDLGTTVDGMVWTELRPKNIVKDANTYKGPWEIEMRLFDRQGRIVSGVLQELDRFDPKADEKELNINLETLRNMTENMARMLPLDYPFQGKIMIRDHLPVPQNILGTMNPQATKIVQDNHHRRAQIFGYQPSAKGDHEIWTKIAEGDLFPDPKGDLHIKLDWQAPRTTIQNGNLFYLNALHNDLPKGESHSTVALRIYADSPKKHTPLPKAHLYGDGRWLGQSDSKGIIIAPVPTGKSVDRYQVTRAGYQSQRIYPKPVNGKKDEDNYEVGPTFQRIELTPQMLLISVDSSPPNAAVFINGKPIGRTPLDTSINRDELLTDIHLLLKLGSGYKDVRQSLGLPDQPVVLRGEKRIIFEQDYLAKGDRLVLSGRPRDAVAEFAKIPENHSDFQAAQIRAAQLCLDVLDDPERSIEFFDKALAPQIGRSIADKDESTIDKIELRTKRLMAIFSLHQIKKVHYDTTVIKNYQTIIDQNIEDLSSPTNLNSAGKKDLLRQNFFLDAWTYHLIALERKDIVATYQAQKKWREFLRETNQTLNEHSSQEDLNIKNPLLTDLITKAESLANQITQRLSSQSVSTKEKVAM